MNEHTLYIYAEDAYGNNGEKTLTLPASAGKPDRRSVTPRFMWT